MSRVGKGKTEAEKGEKAGCTVYSIGIALPTPIRNAFEYLGEGTKFTEEKKMSHVNILFMEPLISEIFLEILVRGAEGSSSTSFFF